MTWWQILLVFVGIPAAVFLLVTGVVLRFATARVPDGLLRAAEQQDADDPTTEAAPEEAGSPDEDDSDGDESLDD